MKITNYIYLAAIALLFASCEIDNYEEPESFFTGNIVYNGEPIEVGAREVRFQLFQPGFGALAPLDVHLDLDGSFSGRFFDGDYKLKFINGQGPFKAYEVNEQQGDTIFISLRGNTNLDIEVLPYYMLRNEAFNAGTAAVDASASYEQIITGADARNIEFARLYLNDTEQVSNNGDYHMVWSDMTVGDGTLNGSTALPDGYSKPYVFARIALKIAGVEDMLFSPVQKLDL
ncbi:DUF3823 domain-containing protein [Leeuwenhoekiella blandensis]|uniref:DUF3823 domain-containing protein n=1 Tax=Leeuwenhoekiella blandensis (strain CECT 7118 / CCUG 51940 / KCTC 22103 / MED217) TaxID=398720 RepID=A3XPQ1_LEEBM|nr:DUF3823 domain-containing protein [Leeuwenhoekiella blandensis]EAQ48476.1 hypothetical protein MED217_13254 [Leeuwenhoekiella blandensis MED217]